MSYLDIQSRFTIRKNPYHPHQIPCRQPEFQTRVQKAAFLVEGYEGSAKNRFSEIALCMQLAAINQCPIFDAVISYSKHLSQVFAKEYCDPKVLVLHVIEACGLIESDNAFCIISALIRPAFEKLVAEGQISEIPPWLNKITPENTNQFITGVLKQYFSGDIDKFRKYEFTYLRDKVVGLSNKLTAEKIIDYLTNHPTIERVFGLIGAAHLSCLDEYGTVLEAEGGSSYLTERGIQVSRGYKTVELFIQGRIQGRSVLVSLFGGYHGELSHYENLAKQVLYEGFAPIAEKKSLIVADEREDGT